MFGNKEMKIENVLSDGIGSIELVEHLGNDLSIVSAARVSYNSSSKGEEADKKLLKYLWVNKHTSPFEMCSFKVIIKCPLFVAAQIFRHRTFSYNSISRRYTSEDIEFYFPKEWRLQDIKDKQGSLVDRFDNASNNYWNEQMRIQIQNSIDLYNEMLDDNVAREQARMVLPQNLYTKFVMFGNLRNWLHFCELRSDSHAQWETRQYSDAILHKIIANLYPETYRIVMESK